MSFALSQIFILSLLLTISLSLADNFQVNLCNKTPHQVDTNCISGGKNVGFHSMRFNDVYNIRIATVPGGLNTIMCDITMHVPSKHGKFRFFDLKRDGGRCGDNVCELSVQDDRVCFMLDDHCELHFGWS